MYFCILFLYSPRRLTPTEKVGFKKSSIITQLSPLLPSYCLSLSINLLQLCLQKGFYGTEQANNIGLVNAGQYLREKYGGFFFFSILYIWGIGLLAAGQSSTIMDTVHGHPPMHHPNGQVFVFLNSSSLNVKYLIFIKIPNNFLKF